MCKVQSERCTAESLYNSAPRPREKCPDEPLLNCQCVCVCVHTPTPDVIFFFRRALVHRGFVIQLHGQFPMVCMRVCEYRARMELKERRRQMGKTRLESGVMKG